MKPKSPPQSSSSFSSQPRGNKHGHRRLLVLPKVHAFFFLPVGLVVFALVHSSHMSIPMDDPATVDFGVLPGRAASSSSDRGRGHKSHRSSRGGSKSSSLSLSSSASSAAEHNPAIAWLMSYPNSGTSYTMTMVERASNRSTATNYGVEVTHSSDASLPIDPDHPEGPYWHGLSGKLGTPRDLPDSYILTKTHCSGRCVNCGPDQYIVDRDAFLEGCARTSARLEKGSRRVEYALQPDRVARMVHLIRNPFANIVARFHLERRHLVKAKPEMDAALPNSPKGFAMWCQKLDEEYAKVDRNFFTKEQLKLYRKAPCRGEFYKYTQWHNRVHDITSLVGGAGNHTNGHGQPVVLTIHYEDYETNMDETVRQLFEFLELPLQGKVREFRELPDYSDHFSKADVKAIEALVRDVASEHTWDLVKRYF